MNTSPKTTAAGRLAALGTVLVAVGGALVSAPSTVPTAPAWLPLAGVIVVAIGTGLSALGQARSGAAARDNDVSDEAAGATMGETPKPPEAP